MSPVAMNAIFKMDIGGLIFDAGKEFLTTDGTDFHG